jgi:hypothetical protein
VSQIGIGVLIGAIEREYELLAGLLPGNKIQAGNPCCGACEVSGVAGVVRSSPRNVTFTGDRDPVLETSKLPNSAGDRRFESISLQQRVNKLSFPLR